MASKKSTKRREEEKKRARSRAQEQQRRQKQAKPSMTPSDLVTGFSADMLAITGSERDIIIASTLVLWFAAYAIRQVMNVILRRRY